MAPAFELPLTSLEGYVPAGNFISLPTMGSDPDFGVPRVLSTFPYPLTLIPCLILPCLNISFHILFFFTAGVLAFLCIQTSD